MVSNIMVIIVALTAVASFIIPNYEMGSAIRIIRFPMMLLASLYGFVGIVVGLSIILAHFMSLESLGMAWQSVRTVKIFGMAGFFIRFPWSLQSTG